MATFAPGQRVQLNRSLDLEEFKLPKGAAGTVSSSHFQVCVLFDDFEQELMVAQGDLHPSKKAPKAPTALQAGKFNVGDRVRLLATKTYGSQTIPVGTLGTVTQDAPSMKASWVLFDGYPGDKLAPNADLGQA